MKRKKYYGEKEEQKKPRLSDLNIDGWDILKAVVGLTASSCATVALHKYAKNAVPEDISFAEKAVTAVGIYFVTGMVGNQVGKYARSEIDSLKEAVANANEAIRKAKEEREKEGAEDGARA